MRLLNELNRNLGFTPQEGRVVLFLVATFLLGIGIKIVKSARTEQSTFDYTASDSEFEARSRVLAGMDSSVEEGGNDTLPRSPSKNEFSGRLSPRSININTASREDLIRLPGIGEAMAERILIYREENGSFSTIDELINVRGIGRKKLDRIAPYCTLGP
jgi:comEA protein